MNSTVDYKRLHTVRDLKAERFRVNRELLLMRMDLEEDKESIEQMFTLGYWMDMIGSKMPHTGMFYSGYRFICSLIQGRSGKCEHRGEKRGRKRRRRVIYE